MIWFDVILYEISHWVFFVLGVIGSGTKNFYFFGDVSETIQDEDKKREMGDNMTKILEIVEEITKGKV